MEREQTTLRLTDDMKEQIQRRADEMGLNITEVESAELVHTGPYSKYSLRQKYDGRKDIDAWILILHH